MTKQINREEHDWSRIFKFLRCIHPWRSQKAFARAIGCTRGHIIDIESRKRPAKPSRYLLAKALKYKNVDLMLYARHAPGRKLFIAKYIPDEYLKKLKMSKQGLYKRKIRAKRKKLKNNGV